MPYDDTNPTPTPRPGPRRRPVVNRGRWQDVARRRANQQRNINAPGPGSLAWWMRTRDLLGGTAGGLGTGVGFATAGLRDRLSGPRAPRTPGIPGGMNMSAPGVWSRSATPRGATGREGRWDYLMPTGAGGFAREGYGQTRSYLEMADMPGVWATIPAHTFYDRLRDYYQADEELTEDTWPDYGYGGGGYGGGGGGGPDGKRWYLGMARWLIE